MMEASCEDYLKDLTVPIEGQMGFIVSAWDNRDYRGGDWECYDDCPVAADSCDNASFQIENFNVFQWGFTEDIPEDDEDDNDDGDDGDDEDDVPEPAQLQGFIADSSELGENYEFFVRGLDGGYLETEDRSLTIGQNNRAFVLDMEMDDDSYWAYWHEYLGGSIHYDVDVSDAGCSCAVGVYLSQLDNDECSWSPQPDGVTPQCATIDIMEANSFGFNTASHPCEFGTCDTQSQCKRSFRENVGDDAYGHNANFQIDASKPYSVETKFWAKRDSDGEVNELLSVETILTQGDNTVTIEQDCPEYLEPLAYQLKNKMMAMSVSTYDVGSHSHIAPTCLGECDSSMATIENIRWTQGDAIVEGEPEEVIGDVSMHLSDCDEGCSECHDAWMSNDPENFYQVCTDWTVYRFGNPCKIERHDISRCSWNDVECLWSYDYSDPRKFRSDTKACRTVPPSFITNEFKFGKKVHKNNNKGICRFTEGCSTCQWSWVTDDENKWKGASAMNRCNIEQDD